MCAGVWVFQLRPIIQRFFFIALIERHYSMTITVEQVGTIIMGNIKYLFLGHMLFSTT